MTRKTVAFFTLGCKLNQYETQGIRESFIKRGYRIVPFSEPADIYVINTCTVTAKSAARSRKMIRRAHRLSPQSQIIAVGCYSQVQPGELSQLEEVDFVLDNTEKAYTVDYVEHSRLPADSSTDKNRDSAFTGFDIDTFAEHSRAFIKIQEGCDVFCSYCIIPYARNPLKSRPPDNVIQQVQKLTESGYREVVVAGTHLGLYGKGTEWESSFVDLLKRICRETSIDRIRLSSLEPMDISEAFLEFMMNEPRICRHLHLPLQSGDNEVLHWMRRPYTTADVQRIFDRLTEKLPHICLGTDIIAGFPGETAEHYNNTYKLLQSLPLGYLHVFPFSARPGTPAAAMSQLVYPEEKKQRVQQLYNLRLAKLNTFRSRFLGTPLPTLIESTRDLDSGCLSGITDNYLRVLIEGNDSLMNRIVHVCPEKIAGDQLFGQIKV